MKVLSAILVAFIFVFAMAGCHGSTGGRHDNADTACQEEMKALMSDQPGFVVSPACDATFVRHLRAMR